MKDSIRVFAPATVANVGCGFDVLGFALDHPGDELVLRKIDRSGVRISKIEGADDLPYDPRKNVASEALLALMDAAEYAGGMEMEIYKGVKPGSGIGSSAASSVAAVFAGNELLGRPFSAKELIPFAMEGERLASGAAHADNVAPSLLGGFALVRSYAPLDVISIKSPANLWAAVIHPQIEIKTKDAREILPVEVELKLAIRQWGNVAGLITGLLQEDYALIGRSLEDVIVEPVRSVLIPAYQQVKAAALGAGALGCSISGSGPSVFALTEGRDAAERVASAMRAAYEPTGVDFEIHVSGVNQGGPRVLD